MKIWVCTFLAPARKVPKEAVQRGAELIAPAIKDAPFGNPRRALGDRVLRIELKLYAILMKRWQGLRSPCPPDFSSHLHFGQKVGTLFARIGATLRWSAAVKCAPGEVHRRGRLGRAAAPAGAFRSATAEGGS